MKNYFIATKTYYQVNEIVESIEFLKHTLPGIKLDEAFDKFLQDDGSKSDDKLKALVTLATYLAGNDEVDKIMGANSNPEYVCKELKLHENFLTDNEIGLLLEYNLIYSSKSIELSSRESEELLTIIDAAISDDCRIPHDANLIASIIAKLKS